MQQLLVDSTRVVVEAALTGVAPYVPAPDVGDICAWCGQALNLDPLERGGCSLCVLVARRELGAPRPAAIPGGAS